MAVNVKELTLQCCDGVTIAAQKWESSPVSSNHPYLNMGNPYGSMIMANPVSAGNTNVSVRKKRILCVHGWYDNCRSFHYLAPNLVKSLSDHPYGGAGDVCHVEIVAIDLPGHGKSSYTSADAAPTVYLESVFYIADAVRQLKWDDKTKFCIIGHSFGASLSLGYAATFPEHVAKLVLLDRGKYFPI
jgi:pimeloyl-ACP methyl ester carboxylesterase